MLYATDGRGNDDGIIETALQFHLDVGRLSHIEVNQAVELLRHIHLSDQDVEFESVALYNFINHI
jgi:hypothetical protein